MVGKEEHIGETSACLREDNPRLHEEALGVLELKSEVVIEFLGIVLRTEEDVWVFRRRVLFVLDKHILNRLLNSRTHRELRVLRGPEIMLQIIPERAFKGHHQNAYLCVHLANLPAFCLYQPHLLFICEYLQDNPL